MLQPSLWMIYWEIQEYRSIRFSKLGVPCDILIISRLLLFFGSTETIPFSIGRTDFQRSISFQNFPELRDKSRNRLILDALSLFQSLLQMIVPGIKEF